MAISLSHKFALLETGEVEPLFYEDGDPRQAYEEDGKFYLDHDVYGTFMGHLCCVYRHDEIVKTSNDRKELET